MKGNEGINNTYKADELKDRLKSAGITQQMVAYELGVAESTVYNKLRGKRKFSCAERFLIEQMISKSELNNEIEGGKFHESEQY